MLIMRNIVRICPDITYSDLSNYGQGSVNSFQISSLNGNDDSNISNKIPPNYYYEGIDHKIVTLYEKNIRRNGKKFV